MLTITYHMKNGDILRERHPEGGDQAEKMKEVLQLFNTQEWIQIRQEISGPTKMVRSDEVEAVEVYSPSV